MNVLPTPPSAPTSGKERRRIRLQMFLLLLLLPVFCIVMGLGVVVGERQNSIRAYCQKALEDFFPGMVAQQRSSLNIERLRALGAMIYYSPDAEIRRSARVEAQALAMDAVFERTVAAGRIRAACGDLRRLASLRDIQQGELHYIRRSRENIKRGLWELFKTGEGRYPQQELQVLGDVFVGNSTVAETRREFAAAEARAHRLLAQLERFGRRYARENPALERQCRALRTAVEALLPLYTAYLNDESAAVALWEHFDTELRTLSEELSQSASHRIYETLRNILGVAARAEQGAIVGFLLLGLSLLLGLTLGRIFVVMPIVWIFGGLQRIRAGKRLFPIPSFFIRELQYMANELTAFSLYLHNMETQSEQLETEKQKFEDLSFRDGLTGIYNRRYFDLMLAEEWGTAQTRQTPLSLLMIDVDKFKNYNDSQGHLMGDDCLRRIAGSLSEAALRPTDKSTRYGGEEFALLLPGVDGKGAAKVAQRVHEGICKLDIAHPSSDVASRVTVSIGLATRIPRRGEDASLLVEMADRALYMAKNRGRNRTCAEGEPVLPDSC